MQSIFKEIVMLSFSPYCSLKLQQFVDSYLMPFVHLVYFGLDISFVRS